MGSLGKLRDRDTFSLGLGKEPTVVTPMRTCLSCISSIVLYLGSGRKLYIRDDLEVEQERRGPGMNRKNSANHIASYGRSMHESTFARLDVSLDDNLARTSLYSAMDAYYSPSL